MPDTCRVAAGRMRGGCRTLDGATPEESWTEPAAARRSAGGTRRRTTVQAGGRGASRSGSALAVAVRRGPSLRKLSKRKIKRNLVQPIDSPRHGMLRWLLHQEQGFLVQRQRVAAGLALAATSLGLASGAAASETVTYTYDALGRLVTTTRSGTVNNGQSSTVSYDRAGNRTNYTVSGAPAPPPSPPPPS